MINTMKQNLFPIFALLFLLSNSVIVNASFYPNSGALFYDGILHMESFMTWNSPGPWKTNEPGYEHDLNVHDPNFLVAFALADLENNSSL